MNDGKWVAVTSSQLSSAMVIIDTKNNQNNPTNSGTFAHPKVGYPKFAVRVVVINDGKRGSRQEVG